MTTRGFLTRFAVLGLAALLLLTPPSSYAVELALSGGLAVGQQDPKEREITAQLFRSDDNATITLRAVFPEETTRVKVSLFNLLGKLVEVHPTTIAQKGNYEFQFRTRGLPNGPYIVVLEAAGQRLINKVMLVR